MNITFKSIFTQWSACKIVRLIGGTFMLAWGIQHREWLSIALGTGFVVFGLLTTGCSPAGCGIPGRSNSTKPVSKNEAISEQ
jgi:hypothetical protein